MRVSIDQMQMVEARIGCFCRCCGMWSSCSGWAIVSATVAKNLPSPAEDLGGEQAVHSGAVRQTGRDRPGHPALYLVFAAAGRARATRSRSLIGTPIGFLLGLSKLFTKSFDPIIQILRPVSPLAWLPLGLVLFQKPAEPARRSSPSRCARCGRPFSTPRSACASIPQDYLNVAKVLQLSRTKTLFKVLLPATLPYMFTGFRLSLGSPGW